MGLDYFWQQVSLTGYQLWVWVQIEFGAHPYLIGGTVVVIILAFTLYKMEVRTR
jgi:hypothetical protein